MAAIKDKLITAESLKYVNDKLESEIDDIVIISEDEPSSDNNKIWIDSDAESVQIPTYDDFVNFGNDIEEDISSLRDDLRSVSDEILMPTIKHFEATSNHQWTLTEIGKMTLKLDVTYYFNYNVPSPVSDLYIYLRDANDYNIKQEKVPETDTGYTFTYKCQQDNELVKFVFQVGSSTETTVSVDVTTDEVGKIEIIENIIDELARPQTLSGWQNKAISPTTGEKQTNSNRLSTDMPTNSLSCYCDSGYSYVVFAWDNGTFLGWYDGNTFRTDSIVTRTTEMDLTSLSGYQLATVLVNAKTVVSATAISVNDGVHFHVRVSTDESLTESGMPADAKSVGSAIDNLSANIPQPFSQNIFGWENKGIAPSTGAITHNAKRLMTQIPYSALSCYVNSGYSFIVFGWDGDSFLGWYNGSEWLKTTMVLRTTELDVSAVVSYNLFAVLVHGTTTGNAVNISYDENTNFYIRSRTDTTLKVKNTNADAFAVGEQIDNTKSEAFTEIKTITGNETLSPTIPGYIRTDGTTVDVSAILTSGAALYCGVYACIGGETFTIRGSNPGSVAGYCVFVDSSYNVLLRETEHPDYTMITAPTNSAYIIIQRNVSNDTNEYIRGRWLYTTVNSLVSDIENIDRLIGGYNSESYYTANDSQALVTSYDTLISMYDALVTANPNYITKNTLTHGTFTNYEYVFSMGMRNNGEGQRNEDTSITKPVVLIMAGVHGYERCSIMGLYLFAKALCESAEMSPLRNGLTIKMIPVVTPSSYNNNTRVNANGVNINRNFDADWILRPDDGKDYSGAAPADQDETQVVQAWMENNLDAVLEIDWHNSAYTNEVCYFAPCIADGFAVNAKKAFFYGIDRIIGHWINDRGITDSGTIYGYTGTDSMGGTSYAYAKKISLNGSLYETSWDVGSFGKDTNETIGVNAEAFCATMKGINEKYIEALT